MMNFGTRSLIALAITVVIATVIGHFVDRELEKRWPSP